MRRPFSLPLAVAFAAVLVVSGCAVRPVTLGTPTPTPSPTPECAAPGDASDAVTARGALGGQPVIIADGPFVVDAVQRSVFIEGGGEAVTRGDLVAIALTMVNATSGGQSPGTARARVLLEDGAVLPGLLDTILCSTVGSRVIGVVPSTLAFGSAGQPDLGIGPDDDVVMVVDVLEIVPLQADGAPADLPDAFPDLQIVVDATGRPTVRIPDTAPPKKLTAATLLVGDGPEVGADDEFLVQFQAINWRTGAVFDETWGDAPRALLELLPGVDRQIHGATVGSRIVVICPPKDAFGSAGSPSSGIAATDTVVYVVDILATTPPPA